MLPTLKTLIDTYVERRERRLAIRALSAMTDHELADIGIDRGRVVDAVDGNLPHLAACVRG